MAEGLFRCLPLNTIIVDIAAAAGGNGTVEKPFNDPNIAVDNAGNGCTMIFKCGTYSLDNTHKQLVVSKRITLQKDCSTSPYIEIH